MPERPIEPFVCPYGHRDDEPCLVRDRPDLDWPAADEPPSFSDEVYDESRYTAETRRIMDEHDQRRGEPSTISGYTRDELRRYVLTEQILHDPSKQGHGYDRCEHCHFTRHPCSVHELATIVLEMLSASEPASAEAVPRAETSVVRPPESPRTGQGPPEA